LPACLFKELFEERSEFRESLFNDCPEDPRIHGVIAVNKDVPQPNHLGRLRNAVEHWQLQHPHSDQCFAENLELAIDRGLKEPLALEISEGSCGRRLGDSLDRAIHIEKRCGGLRPHRALAPSARRAA